MVADRVTFCIERYWEVAGRLSVSTNPNLIGDLKTSPYNYGQAVIKQHFELIGVVKRS